MISCIDVRRRPQGGPSPTPSLGRVVNTNVESFCTYQHIERQCLIRPKNFRLRIRKLEAVRKVSQFFFRGLLWSLILSMELDLSYQSVAVWTKETKVNTYLPTQPRELFDVWDPVPGFVAVRHGTANIVPRIFHFSFPSTNSHTTRGRDAVAETVISASLFIGVSLGKKN